MLSPASLLCPAVLAIFQIITIVGFICFSVTYKNNVIGLILNPFVFPLENSFKLHNIQYDLSPEKLRKERPEGHFRMYIVGAEQCVKKEWVSKGKFIA